MRTFYRLCGRVTLLTVLAAFGPAVLGPSPAQARDLVTSTSSYETASDSRSSVIRFDPLSRTFEAAAESAVQGPEGAAGAGATRGSVVARWSGGARATGRIASYVETLDAENYPGVPFENRQSGSDVDAEIVAQYVVTDSTPSIGPVPVTLDLSFTGRMVASGAAAEPTPWPSLVTAVGKGWARVGTTTVGQDDGRALLDAYNGVDDGGDWDGALDELEDLAGNPTGQFLLHAGGTYTFDAQPGDVILVYLANRLGTSVNDASSGHVIGDMASEEEFGARFSLSSTDAGVSFNLVPEPAGSAVVALAASASLLRRRRRRAQRSSANPS
jgi:hypothetical protein